MRDTPIWSDPLQHLAHQRPDTAQIYFSPAVLQATARRFQAGFPGLVTYAVKANAGEEVLANLMSAGITAFDVASPREMYAVRTLMPDAVLHYNNPVRSSEEIRIAASLGIRSYSVDSLSELEKLAGVIPGDSEITVRLALPIAGAAYDFGAKFGTGPEGAVALLKRVAELGYTTSMTFHPGTQCADPSAWESYIDVCADVARHAGITLARLNVGGGFAANRTGEAPDLDAIFSGITKAVTRHFSTTPPAILCEPGRAMVAEAFTLAARVKAVRVDGAVFLNDGLYGGLAEVPDMPLGNRVSVVAPDGELREGAATPRLVFGPTCDSLDQLPEPVALPDTTEEGDYVLFAGMGAYSRSLSTGFNGYGLDRPVTVAGL